MSVFNKIRPLGFMLLASLVLIGCGTTKKNVASGPPLDTMLSPTDITLADRAASYALENLMSGQKWRWDNPQTGNSGLVRPIDTWFVAEKGQYCRSYEELIRVGKRSAEYSDVACRNEQGNWVAY